MTTSLNGTSLTKKERIAECLRELILYKEYPAGSNLPDLEYLSEHAVELFGISASIGTVRAGEEILIQEKTIAQTQQGLPTKILRTPEKRYAEIFSPQAQLHVEVVAESAFDAVERTPELLSAVQTIVAGLDQTLSGFRALEEVLDA